MRPRVLLELDVLPDDRYSGVPGDVRLRHLLKRAGRLGLKCVGVKSVVPLRVSSVAADEPPSVESQTAEAPGREGAGKVA